MVIVHDSDKYKYFDKQQRVEINNQTGKSYDITFIYNKDPDKLIHQMFMYIKELASKIGVYMINKFKDLLNEYDN